MRPVERGPAPRSYAAYDDAKQDLVNRLGPYCSFCERRIATMLAVEHIQAKSLPQFAHLINEWHNFLLACCNCNSAKSKTAVDFAHYLLPDRDNTFAAFTYTDFGMVEIADGLASHVGEMAHATRELTALNRDTHPDWDEKHLFAALGRCGQRFQAVVLAQDARNDYLEKQTTAKQIAREAAGCGFFSIWMNAFTGLTEVQLAIIKAFPGTAPDCFDANATPVTPRPANGLPHAGKL